MIGRTRGVERERKEEKRALTERERGVKEGRRGGGS